MGQQFTFESRESELVYSIHNSSISAKRAIIFLHGFKGYKDWGHFPILCKRIAQEMQCPVIALNFSHNGTSADHPNKFVDLEAFGSNTFSKELEDVKALIEYLKSADSPIGPIDSFDLIGHSRGGSTAIIATNQLTEIRLCVTWAAVIDIIPRYALADIEEWKMKGVKYVYNGRTKQNMPLYISLSDDLLAHQDEYNVPKLLLGIDKPICFIHGTDDEAVSVDELDLVPENFEKQIIEGANHTFGGKEPWTAVTLPEESQALIRLTSDFLNGC